MVLRLIGVDVGTTSCKAGLFDAEGAPLRLTSRPTDTRRTPEGHYYYDPEGLWETVASAVREVIGADGSQLSGRGAQLAVGVASMAEAGLLVDRRSGTPRTHVLPWFDTRAAAQADAMGYAAEPLELFRRTGLRPSYKYGLAKLLWLQERDARQLQDAVWLSVADYIVYRLTGRMATDPTLAARTFAFRIGEGVWDEAWMERFGLERSLFPDVLPSGAPAGTVTPEMAATGLPAGTPVAVAGHDHICALLAAGCLEAGQVLDSMGTAESFLGVLERLEVGEKELESGLAIVPHVLPVRYCWLGGLSASGGSIEWLRAQLGEEPVPYEEVVRLVEEDDARPTGILYFPYLSGSGAPCPDGRVRAAFVGLSASHRRGDLLRAVLEGTAYEIESIRRTAERMTGRPVPAEGEEIVVVGGGARNGRWIQIKADVSGRPQRIPALPEATLLGAALAAALGRGLVDVGEVKRLAGRRLEAGTAVAPDLARHREYRRLYETGYMSLLEPLRQAAAAQIQVNA